MQLVIGNKNYSSWSLRAWLVLRYFDVPFSEVRIALDAPDTIEQMRQHTPINRVPVLHDGDTVIWDSLAIAEYVNELVQGKAWPAETPARAHARAVCAEMHSGFMALRSQMPMNCRARGRVVPIGADLAQEIARVNAIWTECRRRYAAQGDCLFGVFSVADAFYAPVVMRFLTYGVGAEHGLSEQALAYMQHVVQLPAMQEWIAAAEQETETIEREELGRC